MRRSDALIGIGVFNHRILKRVKVIYSKTLLLLCSGKGKKVKRTIFNTPLITPVFRYLFKFSLRILGWRVTGQLPDIPKFVIIGAPHTSNWDFVMFLALGFLLKGDLRYMGKKELFRWSFDGFFRWCGGVPVDRSKPQGLVEQTVQAIQEADYFQLVITPEGTRRCKIRSMSSTDSGACRPLIPEHAVH